MKMLQRFFWLLQHFVLSLQAETMRRLYPKLTMTACWLLVMVAAIADTGRLFTPDRMSSSLITCICQDRYGYIWMGTEYGLNKFDGYRFTPYLHQRDDTTSITDNEIASLFVDKDGELWVGCAKGLVRYDYERDAFQRYHFPDNREPRINSMEQGAQGQLLIGTAGYGLYSIARGTTQVDYESDFNKRRVDDFYSRIHIDREKNLWRSSHVPMFTKFTLKNGKKVGLRDYQSTCGQPMSYIEYSKDEMLIVCMNGILSYSYQTGEVSQADFDLSVLNPNASIRQASLDPEGNLYLATTGSGLLMIPAGGRTLTRVENHHGDIDLATADIVDVMEDKDQNVWVACYSRGLMQMSKGREPFQYWSFAEQNYRTGGSVTSIAEGDDGDIWCTVRNNGVFRFNREGRITLHPDSPVGTRLIYRDRQGRYWLCTENVLYSYNPMTGRSEAVQTFSGRGLNSMTDDGDGRLYVSVYGLGMYVYDPDTRQGETISMQQTEHRGGYLCNDWIKSLQFDSKGMLWITTVFGTSVMNPHGNIFNGKGWNALLEGKQCYSACETQDGNMLIGTDTGLYIYENKTNRVKELPGAEAISGCQICSMVRDRQGDIWISTSNGIWQYQHKSKRLISHISGNGLAAKEYVLGAILHRQDDRIFLGTAEGITTFLPKDIHFGQQKLGPVYLTHITVNGRSINPMLQHYQLRNSENSFTLEFSLLNYQNVGNIAFEYRLNGSKQWQQTNEGENQITFNQMQPGDYLLEVRAADNGIYSDPTLTLRFTVAKPWYLTWWAYMLYALIGAGFLFLILFNFERQRRRDLEETKMRFLINATHDIRSPLTLIMGALKKANKIVGENALAEQTPQPRQAELQNSLDSIDKNAQRLLLLVNQILDERKIDKNQMHLHCRETDLTPFIMGIFKLFEYNAQQRNITFVFEHPQQPVKVWIDRIQFDKVISNLLSNAFKYTFDGGEIRLQLSISAQTQKPNKPCAQIQVIDSGMGFEDDKTDRFFERFYQGKSSKDLHIDGTGIGLNLCRVLTQMHGGTVSAHNRKDGQKGAVLTVQLPFGNGHLKPEEIEQEMVSEVAVPQTDKRQYGSRNLRILIVDDDAEIGRYITAELSEWYKFTYAANGREGLKLLLTQPFDLVISDVMMPEMDGITMLRSIKSNPNISHVPVILLTSKAEVEYRLEGLKKGADAFLAKPFSMEELHILINNLVDNVRRLRGKFSGAQDQEERLEQVKVKGNNDVLMDRIMKSVNANLNNPDYDVEMLTKDVGISRAQLHRKMKEITGISTSEFIRNLRLEQAARLIKERKINITQVAYSVGFNNQTHFSTVFKKHFGMTPTEYAES